jgi:hypothetical protein
MSDRDYTSKIPQPVRDAMLAFTNDGCRLISKAQQQSRIGNCHLNVRQKLGDEGGTQVFGWRLSRMRQLIDKGVWHWEFHSIWRNAEGQSFDVTESKFYKDANLVTFWGDQTRSFSFENGTSYNSILICEHQAAAEKMTNTTQSEIDLGKIYWTNSKLDSALPFESHSGKYRILHGFPENQKSLESDYNCRFSDGKLISLDGSEGVDMRISYDYAVHT